MILVRRTSPLAKLLLCLIYSCCIYHCRQVQCSISLYTYQFFFCVVLRCVRALIPLWSYKCQIISFAEHSLNPHQFDAIPSNEPKKDSQTTADYHILHNIPHYPPSPNPLPNLNQLDHQPQSNASPPLPGPRNRRPPHRRHPHGRLRHQRHAPRPIPHPHRPRKAPNPHRRKSPCGHPRSEHRRARREG